MSAADHKFLNDALNDAASRGDQEGIDASTNAIQRLEDDRERSDTEQQGTREDGGTEPASPPSGEPGGTTGGTAGGDDRTVNL